MTLLLTVYLSIAAIVALQTAVMCVHAWEHWRYHLSRWRKPLQGDVDLTAALIVPVKGRDLGLAQNLRAFFLQNYPAYRLCFVVESETEPAVAAVRHWQRVYPHIPCDVVVAGLAENCGQKVHNLIRASREVMNAVDVIAFADADGCPHPEWLTRLIERLRGSRGRIVTGYRWMTPARATLVNLLVAAINNQVTFLTSSHRFNLVWGGAWAIRTSDFQKLGLPDAWSGSLNDDLAVTRLAHRARMSVIFEPHSLVSSPIDFSFPQAVEFVRRQYLQLRVYRPTWWWTGLGTGAAALAFIGLTPVVTWALSGSRAFWGPAAGLLVLYLVNVSRMAMAASAVAPFVGSKHLDVAGVIRLKVWAWPVVVLLNWLGLVSAAFGRRLTWRGITYRVNGPNSCRIEKRSATFRPREATVADSDPPILPLPEAGTARSNSGPAPAVAPVVAVVISKQHRAA
jgi:hypothetical protein